MFTDPQKNLEELNLHNGLIVADMGAGSGFYSIPAGQDVAPDGKVYALEVQREMVEHLKKEATKAGVHNVEAIWCNIEKLGGTKLRDKLVDVAIISNVLFQIEDKHTFLKEVARIVKPNGKVLIIDWSESFGSMGPIVDHVFNKRSAMELFQTEHFEFVRDINAGAHHYGIIFKRNG